MKATFGAYVKINHRCRNGLAMDAPFLVWLRENQVHTET